MAKVQMKMPEDFLMKVSRLADKTDEILPKVLEDVYKRQPSAGLASPGAWNCTSRRWRGFTGRGRRPRPWSYSTSSRTAPLMSAL